MSQIDLLATRTYPTFRVFLDIMSKPSRFVFISFIKKESKLIVGLVQSLDPPQYGPVFGDFFKCHLQCLFPRFPIQNYKMKLTSALLTILPRGQSSQTSTRKSSCGSAVSPRIVLVPRQYIWTWNVG
jgi:hypothetical protein